MYIHIISYAYVCMDTDVYAHTYAHIGFFLLEHRCRIKLGKCACVITKEKSSKLIDAQDTEKIAGRVVSRHNVSLYICLGKQ